MTSENKSGFTTGTITGDLEAAHKSASANRSWIRALLKDFRFCLLVALGLAGVACYYIDQYITANREKEASYMEVVSQIEIQRAISSCPLIKTEILKPRKSPLKRGDLDWLLEKCKEDTANAQLVSQQMLAVDQIKWVSSFVETVSHGAKVKIPDCQIGTMPKIYRTSIVDFGLPVDSTYSVVNDGNNWTISLLNSKHIGLPDLMRVVYGCATVG